MGTYMTVIYSDEHAQYILKILLKASKYFGSNNNLKNSILQIRFVAPITLSYDTIDAKSWRSARLCVFLRKFQVGLQTHKHHTRHKRLISHEKLCHIESATTKRKRKVRKGKTYPGPESVDLQRNK